MPEDLYPSSSTVKATTTKRPQRSRLRFRSWILILVILAALSAVGYTEWLRRRAIQDLAATTAKLQELERNSQRGGEEVARQVLEKVRKHIDIPNEPNPTVATIVKAEELKKQNEFYAKAENGDHVIITPKRAILYSAKKDIILDVVPVVLESPAPSAVAPAPAATASPISTTSPVISPVR